MFIYLVLFLLVKRRDVDGESYNALNCCSTFYCDAFVSYGLGAL